MIHTKPSALDELEPGALPAIHWTQTSISRQPLLVTPAYAFTEHAQAQAINYRVVDIGRDNGTHPLRDFDEQLVTRDPNEHLREEDIATRMKWEPFRQIRRGDATLIRAQSIGREKLWPSTLHRHSEHAMRLVSGGPSTMNSGATLTYSGLTYTLMAYSLWQSLVHHVHLLSYSTRLSLYCLLPDKVSLVTVRV